MTWLIVSGVLVLLLTVGLWASRRDPFVVSAPMTDPVDYTQATEDEDSVA